MKNETRNLFYLNLLKILIIIVLSFLSESMMAQNTTLSKKINVFFDCQNANCDPDYVRSNIKMVDFMRDRFYADVHLMVTSQQTGGGGDKYLLNFFGQKAFQGKNDTLYFFMDQTATNDEIREKMVSKIKIGLVAYVLKSSEADFLDLSYTNKGATKNIVEKDPYNYWIYSVGAGGNMNGDANYKGSDWRGNLSAARTTDSTRISIFGYYNQNNTFFKIKDQPDVKVRNKSYGIDMEGTRAWSVHWGYGYDLSLNSSNFNNIKLRSSLAPKIEYSIFPYKDFNSRRIVFTYSLGVQHNIYNDTTIYFKTKETLLRQTLAATTSYTQKWGNINMGVNWSNYFHDFSINKLSIGGSVEWRIVKGLRFGFFGSFDFIHDQISLTKGDATRDDVIARTKLLQSDFNYFGGANIRYQFGSKNNNAVNPFFNGLSYSYSY